jgi:hypothetical protein
MVEHVTAALVNLRTRTSDEEKESVGGIRVPDEPVTFEVGFGPHFVDESRPKRHIVPVLELDEEGSMV